MADGRLEDWARGDLFCTDLTSNPYLLHESSELWIDFTSQFLFRMTVTASPELASRRVIELAGYEELTRALAWWCDAGPFSIDPTPLTDCLRFAKQAEFECQCYDSERQLEAASRLSDAFDRALPVLSRMSLAAAVAEGEEPQAAFDREGVPPMYRTKPLTAKEVLKHIGVNDKNPAQWLSRNRKHYPYDRTGQKYIMDRRKIPTACYSKVLTDAAFAEWQQQNPNSQ